MSKYLTISNVTFTQLDLLLAALKEMGYAQVEHGTNLHLNGWGGQRPAADVVIRKNVIGASFGDLGFKHTAAGYVMIVDDLDIKSIHGGKFIAGLRTAYNDVGAAQLARNVHGAVTRRVEGKKIKITIRR